MSPVDCRGCMNCPSPTVAEVWSHVESHPDEEGWLIMAQTRKGTVPQSALHSPCCWQGSNTTFGSGASPLPTAPGILGEEACPVADLLPFSPVGLFGIKSYGVHVNGFVSHEDGTMSMWIGQRTHTKQTYPGRLDNLVAGGIAAGFGVKETLVKECQEEASIPASIARTARPAGTISYTYEDEAGVFPECQFVYDLEVPAGFEPTVGDGEVQEFYLWPLDQVRETLAGPKFKPNCAMVALDFLIRRGILHADDERQYHQFVEGLHREL
ncbi:thiamin pyrophosphokinase 2 [Stegostoma tigrinum]|uniref:thiamin pyrophosphokinase 2 n=1 Tax=Stegostoma tigrinum TaxID=3053191 RepID=UPI00286FD964|nr:thiamin pyrophosphokinase 2 [Stegostoma tigrinum]